MSTTTIRLPDDLKKRIAQLADSAGMTPHAFMLQAIEERAAEAEAQAEFHRVAQHRWAEFKRSGEAVSNDDMKSYVKALAAGRKAPPPRARKLLP